MSQHTNGPWKVSGERSIQVVDEFASIALCSMASRSYAEAEANARLIAAAPELLEAAKLASRNFKRTNIGDDCWLGDDDHEAWAALDEAIVNATGGGK